MCHCSKRTLLSIISCQYKCPCTFIEMTSLVCLASLPGSLPPSPFSITLLFFPTGQRSSPGGVSHQKETGLSAEGVSYRRQGRFRQFQHQGSAPGYKPGPSEEPAAGTTPRRCVELRVERSHARQQMKRRKGREGEGDKTRPRY